MHISVLEVCQQIESYVSRIGGTHINVAKIWFTSNFLKIDIKSKSLAGPMGFEPMTFSLEG
jgi:hypothetical protein